MNPNGWDREFTQSAFFSGLGAIAAPFSAAPDWPNLETLNRFASSQGVVNALGLPIRFEHQDHKCSQLEYEAGIHATGSVPTRQESWHDFFNALIWFAFPHTKAALNAIQCPALTRSADGRRHPSADAATLFDESGLVLVARTRILADLLQAKLWKQAFWEQRTLWDEARVYVVGHSLLEKSLAPRPGVTGKCLYLASDVLPNESEPIPTWLDEQIAQTWREGVIQSPSDLFPLPVMGIPGYTSENLQPEYYDDTSVFRPPRITPRASLPSASP